MTMPANEPASSSVLVHRHVAHLHKLRTGDFFMGGQFQKPLTPQELGPFVGEVA